MTTENKEQQRADLEKAGDVLMRLARAPNTVGDDEIDEAYDQLSAIEQDPASNALRAEAAEKLEQLNSARAKPLKTKT